MEDVGLVVCMLVVRYGAGRAKGESVLGSVLKKRPQKSFPACRALSEAEEPE